MLRNRGVSTQNIELLPAGPYESMPSQITNDLEVHRRKALRNKTKRKMQQAVEAFENPWLVRTEKELRECTAKVTGSNIDQENRASMQTYLDVLQDKLKNFHCNLGTLNSKFALDGRRRWCVSQGLSKKDQRHLVTNLFQCLPIVEDACESIETKEDGNFLRVQKQHTCIAVFHLSVETAVARKFSSRPSQVCRRALAMQLH